MTTGNDWTLEQSAYEVIRTTQPSLIMTITGLLLRGQTPKQITDFIASRDVFLAGIVEMAIPIFQSKIARSNQPQPGAQQQPMPNGHTAEPGPCEEKGGKE